MNLIKSEINLTMSTREIASLLGRQHSHIKISAERLAEKGTIALRGSNFEHSGNVYIEYFLNKRDSLILVAQNCPEFTAAIVDRWQELEAEQAPKIPQSYSEALQLAADQAKQLELAAPKISFVDNLVERGTLMTSTQVAQKHKKSAVWLNRFLDEVSVFNRSVKRSRVFQQWFIDKGLGEMKQTELGHSQALFTPAGELWISEKLTSEGAI